MTAAVVQTARKVFTVVDKINRWVARRTGLYMIDVWLARRKAAEYDDLAAQCEQGGLSDSAGRLRETAAQYHARAAELAR